MRSMKSARTQHLTKPAPKRGQTGTRPQEGPDGYQQQSITKPRYLKEPTTRRAPDNVSSSSHLLPSNTSAERSVMTNCTPG
eukprot:8961912-Pyramimonas_sp.AAC.1